MERKLFVWLIVISLIAGCLGQQKPTPTSSLTPVNRPPIADFSYSWTGGDKDQPWTCSKITFKAEVSDPDGDYFYLLWLDNDTRIPQALGGTEFETKLWPDGIHTIKLIATDIKGAKTVVEKQINVKYEVPEPVPLKTRNDLDITAIYTPAGTEKISSSQGHEYISWSNSIYTPLLGFYDKTNPVTVDWHIKWALEHGINNLWILVFPHNRPPENPAEGSSMVYYRDGFLKAKYKDRINFNVFLDTRLYIPFNFYSEHNSDPFTNEPENIEKDIEILCRYFFNDPKYNKINEKPIVFLFGINFYYCDNCENKKERESLLKVNIKKIRETAKKNGYEIFLVGDWQRSFHDENADEFIFSQDFDAITSYNLQSISDTKKYKWVTDKNGRRILIAPYDDLVDAAIKREKELAELARKTNKVYIPFVNPGFNNEKAATNTTYTTMFVKRTNPTPSKFEEWVKGVELLIDPKLKIIHFKFNEFTEGDGVEPTREFGFAYLDIIRDNFAIKPAGGWPLNLVPTKNCGCTEYKGWNTEIGMPPPFAFAFFGVENELLKILKVRREENQ